MANGSMENVATLFEAQASSPYEIAMLENGSVGFMIPDYQRDYDWSEKNIERLYYDILNGFRRFPESNGHANAFTFLGTIILVKEERRETEFSGQSLAIVDGQQRLTTLFLFACALYEAIRNERSKTDFSSINDTLAGWLKSESEERLGALRKCAAGSQNVSATKTFPFSRIIRPGDIRGKNGREADYNSPIGKLLEEFSKYCDKEDQHEYVLPALGNDVAAEKLIENFKLIRALVSNLNNASWYEDTECDPFDMDLARRGPCRNLFERLRDFYSDEDIHSITNELPKLTLLHGFVRLLMFSAYFCKCVVLTRVITQDESAAFEIFDALNTTGEPLTALETLKPRVISFEGSDKGYKGSKSEDALNRINEYLDQHFQDTARKQSETKDLVITFALYIEGEKQSKDLATQRNFLRKSYEKAKNNGSAHEFVDALARIAEFRHFYWQDRGIQELARYHDDKTVGEVKLLSKFIKDMKTSMALPILARYWEPGLKNTGSEDFYHVIKAVVAFLVLRRSATGGTDGIDGDFRAIMSPRSRRASRRFNLCAGYGVKERLRPKDLKDALVALLKHKLKQLDKDTWVGQTIGNPLYQQSRELVRFMILLAAHHALPSKSIPGTWEKSDVKPSMNDKNFLNYETWIAKTYCTVEHVAPKTPPERGWPDALYKNNIMRHSLGNLILLPAEENQSIGNAGWGKKRMFYLALTETTGSKQQKKFEEAKKAGINFSRATTSLLKKGERLPLLEPLRGVEEWNKEIVLRRGRNIAGLCWDAVWPWLK